MSGFSSHIEKPEKIQVRLVLILTKIVRPPARLEDF